MWILLYDFEQVLTLFGCEYYSIFESMVLPLWYCLFDVNLWCWRIFKLDGFAVTRSCGETFDLSLWFCTWSLYGALREIVLRFWPGCGFVNLVSHFLLIFSPFYYDHPTTYSKNSSRQGDAPKIHPRESLWLYRSIIKRGEKKEMSNSK
jgi:hypothetical protein